MKNDKNSGRINFNKLNRKIQKYEDILGNSFTTKNISNKNTLSDNTDFSEIIKDTLNSKTDFNKIFNLLQTPSSSAISSISKKSNLSNSTLGISKLIEQMNIGINNEEIELLKTKIVNVHHSKL